jgi:small subunit ribosomal protein S3
MIEKKIMATQVKNFLIDTYIRGLMKGSEFSHVDILKTPLGDKVLIYSSKPGLIIGRKGANIKALTVDLREKFGLNNPQIEIAEVLDPLMDAEIVAERIAASLERFGSARFKGIMHKVMSEVMNDGALGIEIRISGKVPSSRAKAWKILSGYMKKNGDVSVSGVRRASIQADLKSGTLGVQVRIMPRGLILPDKITILDDDLKNYKNDEVVEEDATAEEKAVHEKETDVSEEQEKKKTPKKRTTKKKSDESESEVSESAVSDEDKNDE